MSQNQHKIPWWEIAVQNNTAEILLYEEIDDFFGVDAKPFVEELNDLGEDVDTINLRINSPGGSVFQGLAIFNALKRHKAYVRAFIDGVALSMASGIAMAGDEVVMCENGVMMIHDPQAVAAGSEQEMTRTAKMLKTVKDALVTAYTGKTGRDKEEIGTMMAAETWMSAEDALEMGFIDAIDECKSVAASFDLKAFNVPSHLRGTVNSLFNQEPDMATKTTAGAPQPATLQELETLNKDDAFIVTCMRGEMTLDQARDQLIADLKADNSRLEGIVTDQQKVIDGAKEDTLRRQGTSQIPDPQQAQQTSQPQAAPEPAAPAPKAEPLSTTEGDVSDVGNQPVNVTPTLTTSSEYDGNALAFFKKVKAQVKAELQASGKQFDVNDILRGVHNQYPGLEEAMKKQAEYKG